MKNIPLFTTESGVASLILAEIPYNGRAYIRIQESKTPLELLNECIDFCRAVGAMDIYATGCEVLERYPLYCQIIKMTCGRYSLDDTDAAVFPVTESTLEEFRTVYNQKMKDVPNAAYMTTHAAKDFLAKGNCYFVHRGDALLGIGIADGEQIHAIASVVSGAGRDVLLALTHALTGDNIYVEVATANTAAMNLYNKLGFICVSEIEKWYKIL